MSWRDLASGCSLKRIAEESRDHLQPQEGTVGDQACISPSPIFFLVASCWALCQNPPSTDLLSTWKSVPDAPSPIQSPAQAERFQTFGNDRAEYCLDSA